MAQQFFACFMTILCGCPFTPLVTGIPGPVCGPFDMQVLHMPSEHAFRYSSIDSLYIFLLQSGTMKGKWQIHHLKLFSLSCISVDKDCYFFTIGCLVSLCDVRGAKIDFRNCQRSLPSISCRSLHDEGPRLCRVVRLDITSRRDENLFSPYQTADARCPLDLEATWKESIEDIEYVHWNSTSPYSVWCDPVRGYHPKPDIETRVFGHINHNLYDYRNV